MMTHQSATLTASVSVTLCCEWVDSQRHTRQHHQAIQCHSHWFSLENTGQKTN